MRDNDSFEAENSLFTSDEPGLQKGVATYPSLKPRLQDYWRIFISKLKASYSAIQSPDYLVWSATARCAAEINKIAYLIILVVAAIGITYGINHNNQFALLAWFSLLCFTSISCALFLHKSLMAVDRTPSLAKKIVAVLVFVASAQGILWALIQTQILWGTLTTTQFGIVSINLVILAIVANSSAVYLPMYIAFTACYVIFSLVHFTSHNIVGIDLVFYGLGVGLISIISSRISHVYRTWIESRLEIEKYCLSLESLIDRAHTTNMHLMRSMTDVKHALQGPLFLLEMQLTTRKLDQTAEKTAILSDITTAVNSLQTILQKIHQNNYPAHSDDDLEPQFAEFELQHLFEKINTEFAPLARNKGLTFEIEGTTQSLYSDPTWLYAIISNFVANAIRYTSTGKVSVHAEYKTPYLYIEVRDTGVGIHRDELSKIFQAFYQIEPKKNESMGLGLGLSFVSKVARALGYPLIVESVLGKGSRFGVKVPLTNPVDADGSSLQDKQIDQCLNGRQVAIICPDKIHRARWKTLLYEAGVTHIQVINQLEGLAEFTPAERALFDLMIIQGYSQQTLSESTSLLTGFMIPVLWVMPQAKLTSAIISNGDHVYIVNGPVTGSRLRQIVQELTLK